MDQTLFARIDEKEIKLCRSFNRISGRASLKQFFSIISRLGNGVFWFALIAAMPLIWGRTAWPVVQQMLITGLVGVSLYKLLKQVLVRERPYITFDEIELGTAPLDRYSFPSGHTLHAVSLTLIATHAFPELGVILVPFATLVALSRVILGLHYPSDVLAGGLIGAVLALGII